MKKLMLVLCLSFGCVAAVKSQDTTKIGSQQDRMRTKIEIQDLPAPIRTSLQNQNYTGWTISSAYRGNMNDSNGTSKEIYIVDLKKGNQTMTATFDKDGNRIDKTKPLD
jgi:hypothetical protein